MKFVLSFYGSDFDSLLLPTHLEVFSQAFQGRSSTSSSSSKEVTLSDILSFFRSCTPSQIDLMCQVSKVVRLLLVMPATNAESERTFSAVRRIKNLLAFNNGGQQTTKSSHVTECSQGAH